MIIILHSYLEDVSSKPDMKTSSTAECLIVLLKENT
jgi:hypothetical protein